LLKILKNNKYITRIISYSDKWDMGIEILAKDLNEFETIIINLNKELANFIKISETLQKIHQNFIK